MQSGISLAGLNYLATKKDQKGIIILNDNEMSIGKNIGGFTNIFNNIRVKKSYKFFRKVTPKFLRNILKTFVYGKLPVFSQLGYRYIGPIDGHNIKELIKYFQYAKEQNKSIIVHIKTIKGKGYEFSENDLVFSSSEKINSGIILDKLENSKYYILLRLKVNNSVNPKYYSFSNGSDNEEFTYYSVTQDGNNKKAEILFLTKEFAENEYTVLTIEVSDAKLPEDVYDVVIDAGHGGKDAGEKQGDITEADITLDYAKTLKTSLEAQGFKVKLTRDDNNTDSFTYNDMYDEDGRISLACSSKAKLMISLHLNNGINDLNGFEIYAPCKSNLDFAEQMAKCIKNNTSINFSNNKSFKEKEGVYLRNFTKNEIKASSDTSKSKGFEPYLITTDTPYLYTIREVGGVATGAYADGRNTAYSKNKYYDSNQGIECYQLELGYIKTDLNTILNEKENYINAITEAVLNYTK